MAAQSYIEAIQSGRTSITACETSGVRPILLVLMELQDDNERRYSDKAYH